MGKILFWAVVIIGVLLVTRLIAHQAAKRHLKQNTPKSPAKESPTAKSEEMVRCAHCNVYLPRSDALLQSERFWCGVEHARAGESDGAQTGGKKR
jgi:uncharacterized protein